MPENAILPSSHALKGLNELNEKRLLVVGASSGIGRAVGIQAAQAGARVAFAGRRRELLDDAVGEAGDGALAVRCDVTVESQVARAVEATVTAFGGLDSVIYATAIDPLVRIADVDAATWIHLLATNVVGASLITRAALPHLREVRGRVLFISATSVGRPLPGMGAYASSKAALEELARAWRSEYRDVVFATVAVGMTLGTGVTDSWDRTLLGELSSEWGPGGYLLDNGPGTMECPEVADSILAVLAAPTFMPYVAVLPDPARAAGLG
jgi:NAD(P)-dependent dehydrogenase (short-subunit alcohol dehydrogenase family)